MESGQSGGSFPCPICHTFRAPNFRLLLSHIRLVHATKPGFRIGCTIDNCSRTFINMKIYDNHLSRDHFMHDRSIVPEQSMSDGTNTEGADAGGANCEEANTEGDNSDSEEANNADLSSSGPGSHNTALPDETITFEEELMAAAAQWILKIQETCKLTHSAMDEIIQGVTDFNNYILSKLHDVVRNALEDLHVNITDVPKLAKAFDTDSPFLRPFRGVETHYQHLKYCKKNLGFVVSFHSHGPL